MICSVASTSDETLRRWLSADLTTRPRGTLSVTQPDFARGGDTSYQPSADCSINRLAMRGALARLDVPRTEPAATAVLVSAATGAGTPTDERACPPLTTQSQWEISLFRQSLSTRS